MRTCDLHDDVVVVFDFHRSKACPLCDAKREIRELTAERDDALQTANDMAEKANELESEVFDLKVCVSIVAGET